MPVEEAADTLAEDVHGNTRQANDDLQYGNDDEDTADTTCDEPVKGVVGDDEAEEVFEQNRECETFDGEVTVGIHDVQRAGDSSDNHAGDFESKKH